MFWSFVVLYEGLLQPLSIDFKIKKSIMELTDKEKTEIIRAIGSRVSELFEYAESHKKSNFKNLEKEERDSIKLLKSALDKIGKL
jgi:hypothetical protein